MYIVNQCYFSQCVYNYKRWYMWLWQMVLWFHLPQLMGWHTVYAEHLFLCPLWAQFCFCVHVFTRLCITRKGLLMSGNVVYAKIYLLLHFINSYNQLYIQKKDRKSALGFELKILHVFSSTQGIKKLIALPLFPAWGLVPCEELFSPSVALLKPQLS